jgi:uncharacterized protein YceH (UPF0502 family)
MIVIDTPLNPSDVKGWQAAIELLRAKRAEMDPDEYDMRLNALRTALHEARQPVVPITKGGIRERLKARQADKESQ